jgi:hypothetical protein
MKNVVFWDVTPCDSCKSRYSGANYRLRHQGGKNQRARSNVSSNYQVLTLMMEAICSSKTSVLTRATRRHIAEEGVLHSFVFISYFSSFLSRFHSSSFFLALFIRFPFPFHLHFRLPHQLPSFLPNSFSPLSVSVDTATACMFQ